MQSQSMFTAILLVLQIIAQIACAKAEDEVPSDILMEGSEYIENIPREICNNKDDDGNGLVDDGGGQLGELIEPCSTPCGDGWRSCFGGQWWPCDAPMPDENGNCACEEGKERRCETRCGVGIQSCINGVWSECSAGTGGPEICDNGIDDDCDGQIDEGDCGCINGSTKSCGQDIGECTSGTQTCVDGGWGECIGARGPKPERCNGLDEDCDGITDNNLNGDRYEENDNCSFASRLPESREGESENAFSATIVPDGEEDWFRILTVEASDWCVPFTEECCYKFRAVISVSHGELPLMCIYQDGCSGSGSCTNSGQDTLIVSWSGTCGPDDGKDLALKVFMPAGKKNCYDYTIRYRFTKE